MREKNDNKVLQIYFKKTLVSLGNPKMATHVILSWKSCVTVMCGEDCTDSFTVRYTNTVYMSSTEHLKTPLNWQVAH